MQSKNPYEGFDPTFMLEQAGQDQDLFNHLLELFIKSYPIHFARLKEAVKRKSADQIFRAAHYLVGEFISIGHPPAVEAAMELEQIGISGKLDEASHWVERLDQSVKAIFDFSSAGLKKVSNG